MKTLLVPVDFTPTSENAVDFAAEWANAYGYSRIILLRSLYDSMFENIGIAAEYSNVSQEYLNNHRDDSMDQLRELSKRLSGRVQNGIKVASAISEDPLLRSIIALIEEEKPELVIVGSDNFEHSSDSIIAGNVISIAKSSPVRVLVVPADYRFREVQVALIPFDFNSRYPLDKLSALNIAAEGKRTKLEILYVDEKERYLQGDQKFKDSEASIHNYLQEFHHEIHYSNERDVIDAISSFADKNDLQLIVALPGKNSFLYNLTHKNIADALYRNTRLPVLIFK